MSREEPYYIPIPEEYGRRKLNALYREIPLKDTTSRLLRKYFNAAANLYGIIPLRKLYGIISSQNKSLVTKEEFLAFAEIARHECEDYYILGKSELYYDGPDTDLMAVSYTHLDVYKRQLFFCAKSFHDLTVNLRLFTGTFDPHHALAILRSPEIVVKFFRGIRDFHSLSFPLVRNSGWTRLKRAA